MNNTLYIFCGLPYAGKTTLRKALVKRFGFDVVSIDEIMKDHGMWDKEKVTQEDWDIAYSETYKILKKLLKKGKNVIFDSGALEFHEREVARQIAEDAGSVHKLIYVNTPRDEIIKRRSENEKTKVRGHVKDYLFKRTLGMFEEPSSNENPIIYNAQMNLENWIKNNIG